MSKKMSGPRGPSPDHSLSLASIRFGHSYLRQKWTCGPEPRTARAKRIGGNRIPRGGFTVLPQNRAGLKGTRRAPPQGWGRVSGRRTVRPPGPSSEVCLMVFARAVLGPGPGTARDSYPPMDNSLSFNIQGGQVLYPP